MDNKALWPDGTLDLYFMGLMIPSPGTQGFILDPGFFASGKCYLIVVICYSLSNRKLACSSVRFLILCDSVCVMMSLHSVILSATSSVQLPV